MLIFRKINIFIFGGLFICLLLGIYGFRNQGAYSVSFEYPGKKLVPNTMYYIEAKSPCTIDLVVINDTIKKVSISSRSNTPTKITINARLHTPDVRVTTLWNDTDSTTTLIARVPNGRLHHSISFDIKDGPITSDESFFTTCLNLNYVGLEKVREAVEKQDYFLARTYYIEYLKTRKYPVWFFDWHDFSNKKVRNSKYDIGIADKIVANILPSCNIEYNFGKTINWSINPTKPYYKEWTWQLSRHPYWMDLGKAYWATGDEKYAKAFVRQVRSWIIDNPRPDELYNKEYSRWRTLESGIRMRDAWIECLYRFLPSPSFDDETVLMYVKSIYEQGEHLMLNHCDEGNNRFAMEMNGLYKVAVMFPEFKESAKWETYASQSLYEETERQFYPDGAQKELAPGYHGVALRSIITIVKLAKKNNKSLPEGFVERLEKAYEYYMKIRMPNGALPGVNDSDFSYDSDSQLYQGLEFYPDRMDFMYIVNKGEKGEEPSYKSVWMPWAGWYIMRSGWDEDALYSHFEVGPLAPSHFHEDKLSLIIYGYGNSLLTEGGNYPYDTSEWRKYFTSASAHNVTRIDGKNQNRGLNYKQDNITYSNSPLNNRWISNDNFDFGEGWYSEGFGNNQETTVTQYRALLFVKNRYWLLFDVYFPKDKVIHSYETMFHLDAQDAIKDKSINSITAVNPGKAVLQIAPLRNENLDVEIIKGQNKPEKQGWVHEPTNGHNSYTCRPVSTPIYKRKVSGLWIEPYLLFPLKAGESSIIKSIYQHRNNYIVYFNDGTSLKIIAYPGNNGLQSLSYMIKDGNNTKRVKVF